MPDFGGGHDMNPARARRKAKRAEEPDADEMGGPSDQDQDDTSGDLENISIEPAENGYTVRTSRKARAHRARKGKMPEPTEYRPPRQHVFESPDGVIAHVTRHLRAHHRNRG